MRIEDNDQIASIDLNTFIIEENNNKVKCCICLEKENYAACSVCNICKEGFICCDCNIDYEDHQNPYNLKCPICRNTMVSHSIRNIIINGLLYQEGVIYDNLLFMRWYMNYFDSDLYKNIICH